MEEPTNFFGKLDTPIGRRQAIKVGGIAVVGLVFAKPMIETIRPRRAFAGGDSATTGPWGGYVLGETAGTGGQSGNTGTTGP